MQLRVNTTTWRDWHGFIEWGKRNASRSTKSTCAGLKSTARQKYLYYTYRHVVFGISRNERAMTETRTCPYIRTLTHVSNHVDGSRRSRKLHVNVFYRYSMILHVFGWRVWRGDTSMACACAHKRLSTQPAGYYILRHWVLSETYTCLMSARGWNPSLRESWFRLRLKSLNRAIRTSYRISEYRYVRWGLKFPLVE